MMQIREYLCKVSDAKENETPIYRHPSAKDGFPQFKLTLQQQFIENLQKCPNKKTLGLYNEESQQYDQITYKEVFEIATAIGSELCSRDSIIEVKDDQGYTIKPVGIYMSNRREWTILDLACILYGFTSCPFYDTLGLNSIKYSLEQTQVSICFVQSSTIKVLIDVDQPYLKTIVIVGEGFQEEDLNKLRAQGKEIVTWNQILEKGKTAIVPYPNLQPDISMTLIFTSGTTGQSKATLQSQYNFQQMMHIFDYPPDQKFTENDVYLSYLPLPHVFERVLHLGALLESAEINYYSGNIQNLARDIQRCKPTYFGGVPRVFNRFYDGIQNVVNSLPPEVQEKFDKAFEMKLNYFQQTGKPYHEQLDAAFIKTKAILGGRQRIILTGAAPISTKVLNFLKITLCCQIVEVYGQTESMGGSFVTDISDPNCGHVGGPTISQEFKLVSIPEMGYVTDESVDGQVRGEICIRGPSISKGYFKDPQQTKELIDNEGWVHTGDIGQIINGTLKIIDRKKNLFKLSQGEYVSPEKVENCYLRLKGISELVIFGDSLQNYCVGVVVVDPVVLKQFADKLKIEGDHITLCANKELRSYVLTQLIEQGSKELLNGYEQVKNIYLESKPFQQVGILTDTLKMQRHVAKKHYQAIIQQLYDEIKN
ncbi:unnamed protein product [Paramecium pentaurelia]|uniref:AMP-dependent synthetase/ligase domain-containing protein n=1 Tax=Paramecium pentaurelia TaxID=43138 RepID=A0A8S1WL05_9CILI|nr:unnamed protein product [Paramecium pentaurelia]